MYPEKEGECVIAWCHEPVEDGRNKCAAHHRAKYLCQRPDCNRVHYSNGLCYPHWYHEFKRDEYYAHAESRLAGIQNDDVIMWKAGNEPVDPTWARAEAARRERARMALLGALIRANEEKNRHDES